MVGIPHSADGQTDKPWVENTDRDDLSPIVSADFTIPLELRTANTVLRPLGPEHNEADLAAWTSSIDHIKATPGFEPPRTWPPTDGFSVEQNLTDVMLHGVHFEQRFGFTYTVLDAEDLDVVLGCVYIYGPRVTDGPTQDTADVRSWVIADRPELDVEIWQAVSQWLEDAWPFTSVDYAPRQPQP